MASDIETGLASFQGNEKKQELKNYIETLIQPEQYVGDLYSINYETANVMIHNFYREKVGGIPSLSFLIASRLEGINDPKLDYKNEDTSIILLRVIDSVPLPQDQEAERIRVETAQRVSGEVDKNWDTSAMDSRTRNLFSFAGVQCRIIGTFFFDEDETNPKKPLLLRFGCDISNYYPNRGLKVYKPNAKALETIINYTDPSTKRAIVEKFGDIKDVPIGKVRYASTNRRYQNIDNVPVYIHPTDLLSQKSALFGMTRTGKSNTTKIIAKSVYELRKTDSSNKKLRIGQIIFDPNGEYANDNEQDNNSALKNVWKLIPGTNKETEVVTYGITEHPNDPDRKLMLLNFFTDENLSIGKEIINTLLEDDTANYVKFFNQVSMDKPDDYDENRSSKVRYDRRVLAYRSILAKSGFKVPKDLKTVRIKGLFNQDLLSQMSNSTSDNATEFLQASKVFSKEYANFEELAEAFGSLEKFIRENKEYKTFETDYINKKGHAWADDEFKKLIGILQYPSGTRRIGKAVPQHSPDTSKDYADEVYQNLIDGKLVIIDQSTGEPELNQSSSRRIVTRIFKNNQLEFIKGTKDIPEILVYVEEAHNILPAGNDLDLHDIWVRVAKEGAKYHIGMVYATQEVSSIQKNILKNTANWFISHLNNTDETRELCKYYDFADFEPSIRRAQDKGFLRVKTLSNYFVIPVQVDKFDIGVTE